MHFCPCRADWFVLVQALLKVEGVQDTATSSAGQEKEREQALQGCLLLLEDSEPRVREAAGDCLGLLAQKEGPRVWESAREPILTSIERYWVSSGVEVHAVLPIEENELPSCPAM